MHHVFIVNPIAGKGRAVQMIDIIHSFMESSNYSYEVKITEAPGHALDLAKDAISRHDDNIRLYSVGGDGTLNEIVNGMAGSDAELGIIPCGSGNDTVRSIYSKTDPTELIRILPDSPSTILDLGRLNDKYFINVASIGFDADVVLKSRSFRKSHLVSGSLSYVLGVLLALIQLNKYKVRIVLEDSSGVFEVSEKKLLLAVFANGSYYGGGMKPAPGAKMNDGLLDFCLVESVSRLKIFKFLPAFIKGRHESVEEVSFSRGIKASIESDIPFPVNVDGEITTSNKISLEIIPKCIKVITPL